ncbi:snRNA-activating protein complex subunit 1b [Eucyclogobius newberryi]|uniref:snRNA-activating protein complex subunit 1b n=1 Tax=Eucyclogobius newberryi TaxID=166745 RepID=UPI003B5BB325
MKHFRELVKADCARLLNRFQQTESVRFETFSQIWRDMKFEQIFYGTAHHDNRLFTRLVLDTARDFLLPPLTFQIRAGALYLLYALFNRQTADPPEKIRLALMDWQELQKFQKDSLEAQHFDLVYVLKKLLHMKAVVFTAAPRLLTFERKKRSEQHQLSESFIERPSAPQTLIHSGLLEELSNVHDLYTGLKSSVCPQRDAGLKSSVCPQRDAGLKSSVCPQRDAGLSLVHTDLVQNLRGTVLDFHRWQKDKKGTEATAGEDGGEGPSTQHESSRRAGLLASIKSRAYGQAAEASKARRHRAVEVEVTKPEPSAGSSRYERIKRRTLKYRASAIVGGTGGVWKDSQSNTSISRLTSCDAEKPPRCFKKFKWKIEDD